MHFNKALLIRRRKMQAMNIAIFPQLSPLAKRLLSADYTPLPRFWLCMQSILCSDHCLSVHLHPVLKLHFRPEDRVAHICLCYAILTLLKLWCSFLPVNFWEHCHFRTPFCSPGTHISVIFQMEKDCLIIIIYCFSWATGTVQYLGRKCKCESSHCEHLKQFHIQQHVTILQLMLTICIDL